MSNTTPDIKQGMGIDDSDYDRIYAKARKANTTGIFVKNSNGIIYRFYMKGKTLYTAYKDSTENKMIVAEVFKKSEVLKSEKDNFKQSMMNRLHNDFPDMSMEEKEYRADLLTEANETIKNLIKGGMNPEIAHKVVVELLQSRDKTEKQTSEPTESK